MKLYLLGYIPDAEKIMGAAAHATASRECAYAFMQHISEAEIEKMIGYAKRMLLSSVLDFPYYVFCFDEVSRSFTHQWVRYRIAAHMQQSLRYVKVDTELKKEPWFVIPPSIVQKGKEPVVNFIKARLKEAAEYRQYLSAGVPAQDARFALPIGTKTHIATAMDAEALLHAIEQRTCLDAQWEIRGAAYALYAMARLVSPRIFEGAGPSCIRHGICRGRRKEACKADVENKIKRIDELIKKYSNSAEARIDLTDIVGYRAPRELEKAVAAELGIEDINLSREIVLYLKK